MDCIKVIRIRFTVTAILLMYFIDFISMNKRYYNYYYIRKTNKDDK